jgi:hypothetical protein
VRIDTAAGTFRVKEPSGRETEIERHFIVVCDPVSMKTITLDTLNKTATVTRLLPSTPQRSRPFCDAELRLGLNQPDVKIEDLGHRTIEGVDAHGIMELRSRANGVPTSNDSETQHWCSEELGAMVLLVMDTPQKKGVFHFAMTNIQRAEPPVALFSIPADYKVLEELDLGPQFVR